MSKTKSGMSTVQIVRWLKSCGIDLDATVQSIGCKVKETRELSILHTGSLCSIVEHELLNLTKEVEAKHREWSGEAWV